MEYSESYVYFALVGDEFDPSIATDLLGISPTESWKCGDYGVYGQRKNSCWKLSTGRGIEAIEIDKLVTSIINQLRDKVDQINTLKKKYNLTSILEIVLDIDINPESSTPALGYDVDTIEFLYKTKTTTDVDIYRYDSAKK